MTVPGFSAETSLYKTTVHYRLTPASAQADGVMLQQFPFCGLCHLNSAGVCVQDCGFCIAHPFNCLSWTEPCTLSDCCAIKCPPCNRFVGCPRLACCCRCLGGFLQQDPHSPCHFKCSIDM
jgi:hypothetical protein